MRMRMFSWTQTMPGSLLVIEMLGTWSMRMYISMVFGFVGRGSNGQAASGAGEAAVLL